MYKYLNVFNATTLMLTFAPLIVTDLALFCIIATLIMSEFVPLWEGNSLFLFCFYVTKVNPYNVVVYLECLGHNILSFL